MAIFHVSVKAVSRSAGRSATAAAAYRAGERIEDRRASVVHDFRRKSGIAQSFLIVPESGAWIRDRATLWNVAELTERRSNATVAREYEVALPAELDDAARRGLARQFARHLVSRYKIAADVAIHLPSRDGDQRNHHAHILTTTRVVETDGTLGRKTRILDAAKTGSGEIRQLRAAWAMMTNEALRAAGRSETIDHRSRVDAELVGPGTRHLGPDLTAIERRRRREARLLGSVYVPGSRRAKLNAEIRQARRDIEVAFQGYRDIDAVEKGAKLVRPQAGWVQATVAQSPRPDFLVSAAKAVARREAIKAAADRPWQPTDATSQQRPLIAAALRISMKPQPSDFEREVFGAIREALGAAAAPTLEWIRIFKVALQDELLAPAATEIIEDIRRWEIAGREIVRRLRADGFLQQRAGQQPPSRGRGGPGIGD